MHGRARGLRARRRHRTSAQGSAGPLPAIRPATSPAHGNVTVKRGTLKATNVKECLAIEVPAFVAFYRAATDYGGADDF
jgi:hypothetical protein